MNTDSKVQTLQEFVSDFLRAYAQRETSQPIVQWVSEQLAQQLPDLSDGENGKTANELHDAVCSYDDTLNSLNDAVKAGQSQTEWLSEKVAELTEDDPESAGKRIEALNEALSEAGNSESRAKINLKKEVSSAGGWNKFRIRAEADSAVKKTNAMVFSAAAQALDPSRNNAEEESWPVLQTALQDNTYDLKTVIAAAAHVYAEKGLSKMLPQGTPIRVIGTYSSVAVEGASALYDAAGGNITMTEAMDRMGMAATAATYQFVEGSVKGALSSIPGGQILTFLYDGIVNLVGRKQIVEKTYNAVKTVATKAWEGVKSVGRKVFQGLKSLFS